MSIEQLQQYKSVTSVVTIIYCLSFLMTIIYSVVNNVRSTRKKTKDKWMVTVVVFMIVLFIVDAVMAVYCKKEDTDEIRQTVVNTKVAPAWFLNALFWIALVITHILGMGVCILTQNTAKLIGVIYLIAAHIPGAIGLYTWSNVQAQIAQLKLSETERNNNNNRNNDDNNDNDNNNNRNNNDNNDND